jgi:5'-3' exonuclease
VHAAFLGIDFNCLIHNYLDDARPIESVLEAIDMILRDVCSADRVFIAMDGLVPYAKIVQQRYRRFRKSTAESAPLFDRHQISPGTPYMRDLATAVTSVLAAQAGAWAVRVHDVAATVDALTVFEAIRMGSVQ